MDDSSSRTPKGTPETSSSPTPTPYPEPTRDPDAPAAPPASSDGASKAGRPTRSRTRSKTTRKRTRKRTSSRSSKVDAGDAPKPRPGSATPAPGITVDPARVRKVLEQGGEASHYFGCEVLGLDPRANPDLFALTKQELDDLAPPLARIASRHAAAARLVEASDEILVATIIGKASLRNVIDARWAIDQANATLPVEPVDEVEQQREGGDRGFPDQARDVSSQRG